MTDFLPEHLRHHQAGVPRVGVGRSARGLLLHGVVVAVRFPDQHARGDVDPSAVPGVLCDVLVFDTRHRTVLQDVPVMVPSGGHEDHEVWVPVATTRALSGSLSVESGSAPTPAHEMDGDHVVVGFMADDLDQPVILGQFPHPQTTRRPTSGDGVRLVRYLAGTRFAVLVDGGVELDTTESGADLTVTAGGDVTVDVAAGKTLTVQLGVGARLVVKGATGVTEPVILGRTTLTDLAAGLAEVVAFMSAFGFPSTQLSSLLTKIATSLGAGAPYLSGYTETE